MYNKLLLTALFYIIVSIVIFILNKISPNAHDGGLGLGGIAMLLLPIIMLGMAAFDIFYFVKGNGSQYIIDAVIHVVLLIVLVAKLFL